jgi:hypothetical protein
MQRFQILKIALLLACIVAGSIIHPLAVAQSDEVTVPDVTGLSVPAAAALLNQNGMALGLQTEEAWTESLGQPANTIISQSLAPGSTTTSGTALDITVLRSPNMLLVYGSQVITLINQANAPINLGSLVFNALDGNAASFPAANWQATLDGDGRCAQLWAERRTGPERPEACTGIQRWLSTVNTGVHFWTDLNGVTRFSVVYEGVERTVCEAAAPGQGQKQCTFFLPAGTSGGDTAGYVYLAYTTDRLIVLNPSGDKWMPLAETTIYNYNPNVSVRGASLIIGDPVLFNNPDTVADITRLAPSQCLMFTNSSPDVTSPPEACDVIARLDVNPSLIFWAADFEVGSATDGQRHTCPAATANKLTVCVMPR